MEQNNDNNHLYTLIKHYNEFLYRRDDYRIPSDSQSDHSNNENILKTMNDEVFKHSIEIFKRAKKNLNH
ncbi:hypothetical protein [Staphylococcus epidermidis]|uniref:hypothetical protein n=1 Tax=Staphylococcus epidermidis TaxID=1282 RepID=UPI00026C0353|nr:hypothetical protein [Staphylococcus epidermidis]EJE41095.1 hypothetical protein HMPREF1388_02931 [Staphylococcus epidermidis NIH05003]QRT37410.1 hypothetical protein I6K91_00345 [Staphylococcus epidermidis]